MENYSFDELLSLGDKLNRSGSKTTSESVSLNQKVKEAQAVESAEANRKSTTPLPKSRAEKVAEMRQGMQQRENEREQNLKRYGTADTAKVREVEGIGPFRENFARLAATNPEQAAAEVDRVSQTLGIGVASTPDAPIRKGVHTGADGSDVPYYTNLPGGAGSAGGPMAGARELESYTPTAPRNSGVGEESSERRAVGREIRDAREEIAYGPKGDDVVAREVARNYKGALGDVRKLGGEAASAKWLGMVEKGQLSDAAYRRLHSETAAEVGRTDESEYEKVRDATFDIARTDGVTRALQLTREKRLNVQGNPKHWNRIERELQARARPTGHQDLMLMPDLYLPYSAADAAQVAGNQPGAVVDESAPPTITNPHNGPDILQRAQGMQDESIAAHIGELKSPEVVGTPARTASSYTQGEPTADNPRSDLGKVVRGVRKTLRKKQHESDLAPYDPNAQSDISKLLGF